MGYWREEMYETMAGRWWIWKSNHARRPPWEIPSNRVCCWPYTSFPILTSALLTIRANSGFVNVYGSNGASAGNHRPKPLKAIGNLTTSISTLRFNHDSQLLAIASNIKKDQMRMVSISPNTSLAVQLFLITITDSPAVVNCICKLADIRNPARPRNFHRLLSK